MNSVEIPQAIRDMADKLGVDVEQMIANLSGGQPSAAQPAAPTAPDPGAAAAAAIGGGIPGTAVSPAKPPLPPHDAAPAVGDIPPQVAEGVTAQPGGETPQETLEREKAVLQQELQQTRANMQSIQDARVVGSSGLSGPIQDTPPNLGSIEPGIRFAVRNGLISAESLRDKFGPLIVELFEADMGGVI